MSATYEGCRGNVPLSERVGTATVVVPNVFTPDFDGYNDFIIVLASGNIGKIYNFIVRDRVNAIVWQSGTKLLEANQNIIWTTHEVDNVPEGTLSYTFRITPPTGSALQFQGKICKNLRKGVDCPSKNTGCSFGNQYDNGVFDKKIPSGTLCQ